jgi:Protein of unknown function (DUF433)
LQGLCDVAAFGAHEHPVDPSKEVSDTPPPDHTLWMPGTWVPVAELFNRLADGATLEQILEAFPAISRFGASHALPEVALLFPS